MTSERDAAAVVAKFEELAGPVQARDVAYLEAMAAEQQRLRALRGAGTDNRLTAQTEEHA